MRWSGVISKLLAQPPLALLPWDVQSNHGNKDGDYYVVLSWGIQWFVLSDRDTLDSDDVLRWQTRRLPSQHSDSLASGQSHGESRQKESRSSLWLQSCESQVSLLTYRTERWKICFACRLRWLVTMVAGNGGHSAPADADNVFVAKGTEVETVWGPCMR